jgi:hypothetical protein
MKRLLIVRAWVFCLLFGGNVSFSAAQYVFTNIVDSTMAAPSGFFEGLSDPAISGNLVAFRGTYDSPPGPPVEGGVGIFVGSGGPLTTIAKFGDPVIDGIFGDDFGDPTISGTSVAFRALHSTGYGVFVGSGGPLTVIAKSGDPAPERFFERFREVAISGSTVAFTAVYLNGKLGLFTGNGGPVTTILKTGDPAPSGEFGGAFFPSISGDNIAFHAGYGVSPNPVLALFVNSKTGLNEIAKPGDALPEGTIVSVGPPSISGSAVAFRASYAGGAGIFLDKGTGITTVANTGDAAPSGTFSDIGSPSTNGSEVAFFGIFEDQEGIFLGNGGLVRTLIKTGDMLFGSTIIDLDFSRFGFDPDGSGNFAFGYSLADGRGGIAIGHLVPEPSSWLILSIALVLSFGQPLRTRRHIARLLRPSSVRT